MNEGLQVTAVACEYGWTRVSSFKPQLVAVLLAVIGLCSLIVLLRGREMLPLVVAGITVATGLIALNCKVVHKRGNEYRISTLLYLGGSDR